MAKQKRVKRTSKTRRRTEARRLRRAATREAQERVSAEIETFIRDVFAPDRPVDHAAEALLGRFDGRPVSAGTVRIFLEEELGERARNVAEEMLRRAPGSLTATSFAASVAYLVDQDAHRASRLLDEAAGMTAEPGMRILLAEIFGLLGRVAEGLEMIEELLPEWFADNRAQRIYAGLLAIADHRATAATIRNERDGHDGGDGVRGDGFAPGECPCLSGQRWLECCRPREQQALDRFADRGTYDRVTAAVTEYVDRSPTWTRIVDQNIHTFLDIRERWEEIAWSDEEKNAVDAWAAEFARLAPDSEADDEPTSDADGEADGGPAGGPAETSAGEEPDSAILAYAQEASTSPDDARTARAWDENLAYGLWLVVECETGPGCWVVDMLAGVPRYISMRPEEKARVARWSVLLGSLLPVDGIWRTGAAVVHLHPAEGDMLADIEQRVLATLERMAETGREPATPRRPEPGRQLPMGVAATSEEGLSPEEASLLGKLMGTLLPTMLATVHTWRAEGIRIVNTDGHPICVINAHVRVADVENARSGLAGHPDIDVDEDDDNSLIWWGLPLTPDELLTMEGDLDARYGEEFTDEHIGLEPQRWSRAYIYFANGTLQVEVNSRERLAGFLDILRELGEEPVIIHQASLEPPADLALRRGPLMPHDLRSRGELDDWVDEWSELPIPGVPGRTPAWAIKRPENRPIVEAAIRELEHDADRRRKAGLPAPDTDILREALGIMEIEWLNPFLRMLYRGPAGL